MCGYAHVAQTHAPSVLIGAPKNATVIMRDLICFEKSMTTALQICGRRLPPHFKFVTSCASGPPTAGLSSPAPTLPRRWICKHPPAAVLVSLRTGVYTTYLFRAFSALNFLTSSSLSDSPSALPHRCMARRPGSSAMKMMFALLLVSALALCSAANTGASPSTVRSLIRLIIRPAKRKRKKQPSSLTPACACNCAPAGFSDTTQFYTPQIAHLEPIEDLSITHEVRARARIGIGPAVELTRNTQPSLRPTSCSSRAVLKCRQSPRKVHKRV